MQKTETKVRYKCDRADGNSEYHEKIAVRPLYKRRKTSIEQTVQRLRKLRRTEAQTSSGMTGRKPVIRRKSCVLVAQTEIFER